MKRQARQYFNVEEFYWQEVNYEEEKNKEKQELIEENG